MNALTDLWNWLSNVTRTGKENALAQLRPIEQIPNNMRSFVADPRAYLAQLHAVAEQKAANSLALLHASNDPRLTPAQRQQAATAFGSLILNFSPMSMGVIKEPGGNWLSGSVEHALRPVKRTTDWMAAENPNKAPAEALNNWIDQKLTKYVKNDLGTERDPIRALAEKGILHVDPGQLAADGGPRTAGPGIKSMARSDLAKAWEGAADAQIVPIRAGDLQQGKTPADWPWANVWATQNAVKANPWLTKLNPQDQVYFPAAQEPGYPYLTGNLGFPHLIDELRNAVHPDSDLPRELRLTPEQLGRTSVPDAVRLVHKINQWRLKAKTEANLQAAKNPATHVLKRYDTIPGTQLPNTKGLHWVELKSPAPASFTKDTLPAGYRLVTEQMPSGNTLYGVTNDKPNPSIGDFPNYPAWTEQEALDNFNQWVSRASGRGHPRYDQLESALKYEGDQMGHCVGGYCPDVSEGRSRIFSLRDAKGQPHVTVETSPPTVEPRLSGDVSFPGRIVQIKGRANRKPTDEYLPFVQDFVRTQGPWSDVGDRGNTGMTPAELAAILHPQQ